MSSIKPFPLIEKAVKEVIEANYQPADGKTGGDMDPATLDGLFVQLSLVPGVGSSDKTSGEWMIDIDVFGTSYGAAMNHALALEALLLAGRFTTGEMIVDNVYQNASPAEGPWDDDSVFRISASYVFTARRRG